MCFLHLSQNNLTFQSIIMPFLCSSSQAHSACSYYCAPLGAISSAVCNVFSSDDMSCVLGVRAHQSSSLTAISLSSRTIIIVCCYFYMAKCQISPHLHYHFIQWFGLASKHSVELGTHMLCLHT
ncbi:hypothetical protein EV702DRAFT_235132 [Suillus placidus]|uniref:Uncharacterized protein n=1 Tax=Suillus placidus TaxID=48579 RepID=A0A9P7D8Z9_9AGAM|nr:hypothetical protein EV702DRAFT_235132 [Suillus placidus]